MRLFDNFCSCKGKQLSDKTTVSLRLLFHFLAAACCVIVGKSIKVVCYTIAFTYTVYALHCNPFRSCLDPIQIQT